MESTKTKIFLITFGVLIAIIGLQHFRIGQTKKALKICRELPQDTIRDVVIENFIDTFYARISDTVFVDIKHPEPDSSGIRTYLDTFETDIGNLYSTSMIEGYMRSKQVSFDFNIPEIRTTTIRTEKTTVWREKRYNRFFVSPTFSGQFDTRTPQLDLGIGITYLPANDRFYYHYSYSPWMKAHSVGLGIRIFKF